MVFKSSYKLTYTVNKQPEELLVVVELKMVEGMLKPRQNIFYGEAIVNGKIYNEEDLTHCVNAKFAAEKIGLKLKEEIKKKYREEKKSFKALKEELKEEPNENKSIKKYRK